MNKELRYAFDCAIRDVFCLRCGNRFDSSKCHEYDCWQKVVLPIREALEVASGESREHERHDMGAAKFGEWIPFTFDDEGDLNCELPYDGQEIIISGISKLNGRKWVCDDEFCDNGEEVYLDSQFDWGEVTAWMPFPEPYDPEKGSEADG